MIDIDYNFINSVYDSIRGMEVHLDPDPLSLGPKRLQGKVADSRNMLTIVQRNMMEISHKLHLVRRELRAVEAEIEVKTSYLLSNDIDVKSCKSVKDREAMAQTKMSDEIRNRIKLNSAEFELESVILVLKTKDKDLKDTLSRLRDQIKLCQEEISLHSKWGDPDTGGPNSDSVEDVISMMVDNKPSKPFAQKSQRPQKESISSSPYGDDDLDFDFYNPEKKILEQPKPSYKEEDIIEEMVPRKKKPADISNGTYKPGFPPLKVDESEMTKQDKDDRALSGIDLSSF